MGGMKTKITMWEGVYYKNEMYSKRHLCQTSRRPKYHRCLGCATQNSPPNGWEVCMQGFGVAQAVERHRDTPNFCVRVISDIYQLRWSSEYHENESVESYILRQILQLKCSKTECGKVITLSYYPSICTISNSYFNTSVSCDKQFFVYKLRLLAAKVISCKKEKLPRVTELLVSHKLQRHEENYVCVCQTLTIRCNPSDRILLISLCTFCSKHAYKYLKWNINSWWPLPGLGKTLTLRPPGGVHSSFQYTL